MYLYPIKFKPIYKQYLWGGTGFEKLNRTPPGGNAAESWEIACHKNGMSIIANGHLKGKTLQWLIKKYGADLLGTAYENGEDDFPLLVKFINARKKLSVQVHPDDDYALKNEGEKGKNEAWLIIDAKKDAEIVLGINKGINSREFKEAVESNSVENCLKKVRVKKGDMINIPAGLIHAIGEGIMLAEVQQNSNITYRVYDYGRKDDDGNERPLHIEKALDVINFHDTEKEDNSDIFAVTKGGVAESRIISNKFFCMEMLSVKGELHLKTRKETFIIYIFTDGEGDLEAGGEKIRITKGDVLLLPACLGAHRLNGDLCVLKACLPSL